MKSALAPYEHASFEMHETLSIINQSPKLLEGPRLLHSLIASPQTDAIALEYSDADGKQTCLSYAELHSQAERLASRLAGHRGHASASRPEIIPLYISQCPSLYISILAILKSGAAFCPLNLDVPEERLKFILNDTQATVILTTSQLRATLPPLDDVVTVIVVDEDDSEYSIDGIPNSSSCHGSTTSSEQSLAYIMYTSGSTGLPKAVCLPHLAVTQSLLAHDRHIPKFKRFLQFASPTFDVSVFEIFFPWIRGCTLVSCERTRLLSDLSGNITSLNIDAAELTPSVAASLVRKRDNVPTLKLLLTIGEMLNLQVINEFGGSDSQSSMLWGMYGPTEAAIHCTLQPAFHADMPAGNIGIPLDTVSCFIVKPAESNELAGNIEVLPIGEVGELAVGGHQLAAGYLNRDEQTRATFISHPVYGNLYRTGDKAILHSNGLLECKGRISAGQVKLRGQRIELGEVEHAASKVSSCRAVVASVISGQLVVFCIIEDDETTVDDIKNVCRNWLPAYMVPSDVAILEDFPYLPSGKIDKRTLESNYKEKFEETSLQTGVVSPELRKLLDVLRSVLQRDITPSAELGAAGLDSLKAIQVTSQLRKAGFPRIGALDLLASRTAQDLETLMQSTAQSSAGDRERFTESKLQHLQEFATSTRNTLANKSLGHEIEAILPCTPLQDAMLSETARNSQAYCNSFSLSLPVSTTLEQLRGYLREIADKHELLRSGFAVSGSSISTYAQLTWKQLDDSSVVLCDKFDDSFTILDQTVLLRPLRVQCRVEEDRLLVLFQIHHALYDQWSIEILIDDLNELIQGRPTAKEQDFGAVNHFFMDLRLDASAQSRSVEFWQSYLSGLVPGQLPSLTSEVKPAAPLAIAAHDMEIDMPALRRAAQEKSCSAHVFLQAAFTCLLGMYMGSSDVTFGTVFSGRTLAIPGVENIFGPILSTLPTRVDTSETRRFSDILRKLQGDNRDIMQHSTLSLSDIRKASSATPGQALFDSIFVWQETARESQTTDRLVHLIDSRDYLEFNLTLELEPSKNGISAKATYQPGVLTSQMVGVMLRQLESIVSHAIAKPDVLVDSISDALPTSVLSVYNEDPQNFIFNKGLGRVAEKHALNNPDKPALCFARTLDGSQSTLDILTYQDLESRANRLAHYLISVGTQPDDLICVCMEKSPELYVSILAIVKAGAGYLPLVPETPPARIRQILSEAGVKVSLVDAMSFGTLQDLTDGAVFEISAIDLSRYPATSPDVVFDPSHLAYAIFTSGTTGKPKGVLITQENIMSNLTVLEKVYPVTEDSRMLQATSQVFDVSVFEIFFSWSTGICLCSASKDVMFRDLGNAINQLGATHLSMTPTVASLVDPSEVPRVKFLVAAGEAITPQVHKAWAGRGLYNGYGPSETTNVVSVNSAITSNRRMNSIGLALENTSAFVLARRSEYCPLPLGALGELCFGGQQVFRGYQHMQELTESKVVDHENHGRIYRTGDLARMLPDGTILLEGRIDDQRKLRGQRIELGEISSNLLVSASVHDCAVQIVGEDKQHERLVAFWVPKSLSSQEYSLVPIDDHIRRDIDALYEHLSNELPAYMIPTALIPITAIPRTIQGKVDRRRLQQDLAQMSVDDVNALSQAFADPANFEPLSDLERAISKALATVLHIDAASIGRSVSFFALGLDSVSAIRLSQAIKSNLGVQIDVSAILKHSSVARLADLLESRASDGMTARPSGASTHLSGPSDDLKNEVGKDFEAHGQSVESILPCTPLQEAMLSASSSSSSSAYYNRTLFKLSGDLSRIRNSWEIMLTRHEILRTAFKATDDGKLPYLQVVLSRMDLPWAPQGTLNGKPESLLRANPEDKLIPVLGFRPPYQLKTYESGGSQYLLLEMHHTMYDGNAMSNLLRDLENAYHGAILSSPPRFASFIYHMLSTDLEAGDDLFRRLLDQYLPKPFPKKETNTNTARRFRVQRAELPMDPDMISEFLRKHSVSLLGLVQAAWAKVLAVVQDDRDVCFGNVVSGRSVPVEGVDRLVAPCFNTVPVRVDTAQIRNNLNLIKALQAMNVETMPFQLMPLRRIQARHGLEGRRLFDSLVLLQGEMDPLDDKIWTLEGDSGEMDFPCIVEIAPSKDVYTLSLHLDEDYFGDADISHALCSALLASFASCVKYPSSDLSDLIDFNQQQVTGLLKPDESYLVRARATLRERAEGRIGRPVAKENWSRLELDIRQVLSAVSGTPEDRITRDMTIYRLGLDSISAIQVSSRLRKQGLALTAANIMESPSCSQLASVAQSLSSTPLKHSPAFDLEAYDRRFRSSMIVSTSLKDSDVFAVRPCTPVQSGMISQSHQSDGLQYVNHVFYLLDTQRNMKQMEEAWAKVLNQHEMLRTGFSSTDDVVHPYSMITYRSIAPQTLCVESGKLAETQLSLNARQQIAINKIQEDITIPPWRWDLFEYNGKSCLQFSAHHALFDAETLRAIQTNLHQALKGNAVSVRDSIDSALSLIVAKSINEKTEQEQFWSSQLNELSITRFPNLCPTREPKSEASVQYLVCEASKSDLEAKCRELGVSMLAAGQLAWARLLAAYTGEPRVTFGVVSSGRNTPETNSSLLPCITTLPLVVDTSIAEDRLLPSMMAYNAALQNYQFTPLTDVQKYAGLPREALFDTLFAYQKPMGESDCPLWETIHESAAVDYPISIELELLPNDKLGLRLTTDASQIPTAQGKIILMQLQSLLLSVLGFSVPTQESCLSIVPAKDPVLPTKFEYLHDLVGSTIAACPEKIALEFVRNLEDGKATSQSWTYRQLDQESNRIAQLLLAHGVQPNSVIATSFDKCPEASFAFLGILKAGCAFCAIDPTAPTARKTFILEDSNSSLLLTFAGVAAELADFSACEVIDIVNNDQLLSLPAEAIAVPSLTPSSISYVLYTSGTTGTPKGCELTHDNAVQAMLAFQRIFAGRWTDDSRWLQFASYHFDVAVVEQFWTWSVGMRLVCAPRDLILEDLPGFIDAMQISHLDLTPSLGRLLDPASVPSLHSGVFITGGEAVKQDMVESWGDVGCLYNFYGPTECTIGVTTYPNVPRNGKPSNIGWQFDNVGIYVLAPGGTTPVLRGAIGELCISGKLVGKGYLNRPELTADCFPFLTQYNERVYRTGDLVRVLHNDSIDFLGRKDNQVKLRGQRLEIDEIEAVIRACSEIQDIVCLVAKHPKQQKDLLVGFIGMSSQRKQGQPQASAASEARHLIAIARTACEEHLPGYMVPTHFIPVDQIPLSINNKVEEKQLRHLYSTLPSDAFQEYSAQLQDDEPLNAAERSVAQILASLLKVNVEDLRGSSNVFSLGLSSISAIQFSRKLKAAGFSDANVTTIMKNPTVSRLAKSLGSSQKPESGEIIAAKQSILACRQRYIGQAVRVLGGVAGDYEAIAPCTPLQQGIISRSVNSESLLYFNSFRYTLQGIDIKKLQNCFQTAVERTQILRTSFIETDDGYVQVVRKQPSISWFESDASSLDVASVALDERKSEWRKSNTPRLHAPFEIALLKTPDMSVMEVHIHHAVYDGNSYEMLLESITQLYHDGTAEFGRPFIDVLPYGPLREVDGAKEFWQSRIHEQCCQLMPAIGETAERDVLYSTTVNELAGMNSVRKSLNVTLQAITQSAWLATLRKYYQGGIGVVVSGRAIDFDGAETVIGPLFNTIPFHPSLSADHTWEDLVQDCHNFSIAALPFQHTPLRDVTKWCKATPSQPLFDSLFVFQGADTPRTYECLFTAEEESQFQADYPLAFEVGETLDGQLQVTISAQASICTLDKAKQLIDEFAQALAVLVSDPGSKVGASTGHEFGLSTAVSSRADRPGHLNGVLDFTWSPEARILRAEIAQLAGVDEVDVDEHVSIFELGLDSVDAVKLSSRLKKQSISVAVSALMRMQTIPRILDAMTKAQSMVVNQDAVRLLEQGEKKLLNYARSKLDNTECIERVLPASPMQEALIYEMVKSSYETYFNHDVLRIPSNIDLDKLEQAWGQVIAASPILRTGFLEVDDPNLDTTFAQVVTKPSKFCFSRVVLDEADFRNHMKKTQRAFAADTTTRPQFMLCLASTDSGCHLIISIAHALYDGFSLSLLHEDVKRAYFDQLLPRPSYDEVLEQAIASSGSEAMSFWRSLLAGATKTHILADCNVDPSDVVTHRKERKSAISSDRISMFCKKQGVTVQALCQTAWALLLAHQTKSIDVIYGVVLAGRDNRTAEEVMFPTMNTVVMRSVLHGSRKDMLHYMNGTIADIVEHQHFPLRQIQAACQNEILSANSTTSQALFDTLFTFQKTAGTDMASENLYESVIGASDVEYPVAVEAEMTDVGLVWRTACKSLVFSEEGTESMLELLDSVVVDIVTEVDRPTLSFEDRGVSICNLPIFERSQGDTKATSQFSQAHEQETHDSDEWSELESDLRNIISQVTRTPADEMTKRAPLQNLGVDSINAIKIAALLRKRGMKIAVSQIIQAGCIANMATLHASMQQPCSSELRPAREIVIELLSKRNITAEALGLDPKQIHEILPATAGQVYMLSAWQTTKGQVFFAEFKYVIKGDISARDIENAWNSLVARHAILRTTFHATGDVELPFVQIVGHESRNSFVYLEDGASGTVPSEIAQPFARLSISKTSEGFSAGLKIHHALYDAVSLPLLIQDFEAELQSRTAEPRMQHHFIDFIAAGNSDAMMKRRRAFWTTYLQGAQPLQLRPSNIDSSSRRTEIFDPATMTVGGKEEASLRKQGISMQSLFFAAYAKAYYATVCRDRVQNEDSEVVLGIYLANRSHMDDLSSLSAPTVNLLPIRVRAPHLTDIMALAKQIQVDLQVISKLENSSCSLSEIAKWTGVKVDTFVNFIKLPEDDEEEERQSEGGITIDEVNVAARTEKRSLVHPAVTTEFRQPKELGENTALEAYPVSVFWSSDNAECCTNCYQGSLDVEATVANGELGIGVFGWESMLGLEGAEDMIENMKESIKEALVG